MLEGAFLSSYVPGEDAAVSPGTAAALVEAGVTTAWSGQGTITER